MAMESVLQYSGKGTVLIIVLLPGVEATRTQALPPPPLEGPGYEARCMLMGWTLKFSMPHLSCRYQQ